MATSAPDLRVGVNVYPEGIKGVVNSFLPRVTGEMRILLDKPGPEVNPPLKLKVEYAEGLGEEDVETLKKEMKASIRLKLEVSPDIEFVAPGGLGRELSKTGKQKLIEKITAINNRLLSEEAYLSKLLKIKAGLMQDLLTGNKNKEIKAMVAA